MNTGHLRLVLTFIFCSGDLFAQRSEWHFPKDTIVFTARSARLSPMAKRQLSTLADRMKANPGIKLVIEGINPGNETEEQLCWHRVMAVIDCLCVTDRIDRNRFIFNYHTGGLTNRVVCRLPNDGEYVPDTQPYPPPNGRLTR